MCDRPITGAMVESRVVDVGWNFKFVRTRGCLANKGGNFGMQGESVKCTVVDGVTTVIQRGAGAIDEMKFKSKWSSSAMVQSSP